MPGNHGEISVDEQNRLDNSNNKTRRRRRKKKKKKKDDDDGDGDDVKEIRISDNVNQNSIRKRFIAKIRKKPKSPKLSSSSGSRKGGCFSVISHRRAEEGDDDDDDSPLSDPNDESFTHEMLRVMLENNDFFCDDCNPHK